MNSCLLVIDPQKDFISLNGIYASRHSGIIQILKAKQKINDLLKAVYNKIDIFMIYSDYKKNQFGENLSICIPGTEGHKLDIETKFANKIIPKNDHSAFSSSEFKNVLEINSIKNIYLSGFLAEYCIKYTAIDALSKNYSVYIIKDCIGTGDDVQENMQLSIVEIKQNGGIIIDSVYMINHLK